MLIVWFVYRLVLIIMSAAGCCLHAPLTWCLVQPAPMLRRWLLQHISMNRFTLPFDSVSSINLLNSGLQGRVLAAGGLSAMSSTRGTCSSRCSRRKSRGSTHRRFFDPGGSGGAGGFHELAKLPFSRRRGRLRSRRNV